MNKGMRRLVKWIGYPLFAFLVFFVALYMSLPYDKVKRRIEQQLSTNPALDVTIGELGPAPLLGLKAKHVVIRIKRKNKPGAPPSATVAAKSEPEAPGKASKKGGKKKGKKDGPLTVVLEQVTVKTGLLALIRRRVDVSFSVNGLDGTLEGSYQAQKKKGWSFKGTLKRLNLGDLPLLADVVGLPIDGHFSAEVDLTVPKKSITSANGSLSIECDACSVGDGKKKLKIPGNMMLKAGVTVPKVRLGKLIGQISVDKGTAKLKNLSAKSPDMELLVEGSAALRQPVAYSNIQAYLKFKIMPEFKKKNPVLDLVEGGLQNAKRADGFYGLRILGTLKNPKPLPSRVGPGKGGAGGGMPRAGGGARFRTFTAQ